MIEQTVTAVCYTWFSSDYWLPSSSYLKWRSSSCSWIFFFCLQELLTEELCAFFIFTSAKWWKYIKRTHPIMVYAQTNFLWNIILDLLVLWKESFKRSSFSVNFWLPSSIIFLISLWSGSQNQELLHVSRGLCYRWEIVKANSSEK